MTYKEIINEIKRNLTGNSNQDKSYLIAQSIKYKNHEYSSEIIKEISILLLDCLSDEEQKELIKKEMENDLDRLNLTTLKENINYLFELGKYLESDSIFDDSEKFPFICNLKYNPKNDFLGIFLYDILTFLSILGISDGTIHDNEVAFINYILNTNMTKNELIPMITVSLKENINQLPISFMILHEVENYFTEENANLTENLFLDYEAMGKIFIAIDENIDNSEIEFYNEYMNNLRTNLDNFKLSNYQTLVKGINSNNYSYEEESEEELLENGIQELKNRNYQEAEDTLKKVVKINPNNDTAWGQLCILYLETGNDSQALNAINHALEINSNNAYYWFDKGDTLFWLGDFEESIKCFDKSIELGSNETDDALAIKGMAFVRLNKMSEAKDCLMKSLELNPKNEYALKAVKNIPNFVEVPMLYDSARQVNINPLLFSKVAHISGMVDIAKANGVEINFEYDFRKGCILSHNENEYYFNLDELDGAIVYVNKISGSSMYDNMSDESRKEVEDAISGVLKKYGYK